MGLHSGLGDTTGYQSLAAQLVKDAIDSNDLAWLESEAGIVWIDLTGLSPDAVISRARYYARQRTG